MPASPIQLHTKPHESHPTFAILGLILAFIAPPIGAVISIIALGRRPRSGRTLSLIGAVVGTLGTVIIGLLMLIMYVASQGIERQAKDGDIKATAQAIQKRVESYHRNNGSYPSTKEMADATWIGNHTDLDDKVINNFVSHLGTYDYMTQPVACEDTSESPCDGYQLTYRLSGSAHILKGGDDIYVD